MSEGLVLVGALLAAASGAPGLWTGRHSRRGEFIFAILMIVACLCGLAGVTLALTLGASGLDVPWAVPGGRLAIRLDGIAIPFVIQIFVIAGLGAIYGLGYWRQPEHERDGRKLRLFYGLMTAGMVLLTVARNAMLFMVGWEIMAAAAFLTVTTQDERKSVRDVGHLYMASTRLATLCLFALFALLSVKTGTFDFDAVQPISGGAATAVFLLALVAFGLKAGLMPMHVWLPGAHASAPSHVSALMSGVLIKMGIYGLVRTFSFFPHPPLWWGQAVLLLGAVSGVLGVAFAIGQHDAKRLLAYHSVENIGIICMGLGLALMGRTLGSAPLLALGLGGALLHTWNHGLFKGLLFLSAGSVLHATETRDMDELGGLSKRMPWTSLAFLLGAVAICGLPPLNGFVSELMIYLGLFETARLPEGTLWLTGALGAPALALIGALALACFVKAFGATFLGEPRSHRSDGAHEASRWLLGPMAVLGGLCVLIGFVPWLVTPILDKAVLAWAPEFAASQGRLTTLAPLSWISFVAVCLAVTLAAAALLVRRRLRRHPAERTGTWDCGYVAPGPTMQYSSSSFAQTLVGIFSWALRPKVSNPNTRGIFLRKGAFTSHVDDLVLDSVLIPAAELGSRAAKRMRWLQRGNTQAYLLYIFLALIVLLLWR